MDEIYEHIAQTIRQLRKRFDGKGISQEALSEKLGEPANAVSRWETTTYRPSAEQLEKLARFFGVSVTVFFPGMKETSNEQLKALMSATGGLSDDDLEEVIRYAEFRKARSALKGDRTAGRPKRGAQK